MNDRRPSRRIGKRLDEWFPRIVRYCGLGLLLYAAVFDHLDNPAMLPLGFGLVFFKNIYRSTDREE